MSTISKQHRSCLYLGFILLCLVSPFFSPAFSQTWTAQTSGFTTTLSGVSFADSIYGWAIGNNGTILHTDNGGVSWTSQISGTTENLYGVCCVNTDWAWSSGNLILRTTDGGAHWTTHPGANKSCVTFVNSNLGWVVGGGILHTTNGGTNWLPQFSTSFFRYLRGVDFVDANNGWAVGSGATNCAILHTTDGGLNWSGQSNSSVTDLYGVDFVNANVGWAVGASGAILNTTNGGANWWLQTSNTTNLLTGVKFTDLNSGWVVGNAGTILHTTNGGTTWETQINGNVNNLYGVAFTNANNGWAVGDSGTILHYQSTTSIPNETTIHLPTAYSLNQNYPNPFNPKTEITYSLPTAGNVTLDVFDLMGRKVASLVNDYQNQSQHRVSFDASRLPSGTYFYRLILNGVSQSRKMVLMK